MFYFRVAFISQITTVTLLDRLVEQQSKFIFCRSGRVINFLTDSITDAHGYV